MEPRTDTDERVESVPWEHIGRPDGSGRRRLVILAVAVFVGAVTASATRTLWPSPPLSAQTATTLPAPEYEANPPTVPPTVSVTTQQRPVTEADLRAILPADAVRAVSAHAQWFVTEWLTVDGAPSAMAVALAPAGTSAAPIEASARSFVESAIVLSVTETGVTTWDVAVLVRTLSASGGAGYVRIPPRVFVVTVGMGDEGPFVLDLPTPAPLPVAAAPELDLDTSPAPTGVIDAGVAVMREAGLVDESSVSSSGVGGLWRVSGVVRDGAGVPIEVVVWLDGDGSRVPAPPVP